MARDKSFSPEMIELMAKAFEAAKRFLPDGDTPGLELLAMRIITSFSQGESDCDKLAAAALAGFCAGPSNLDRLVSLEKETPLRSEG
jgi:hypothetical protein